MEQFTRRETQVLTRSSSSRLVYLEKTGIIVPHRAEPDSKAVLFYTWDQILEIRAINQLRRQVSFQTIRKVVQFLDEHGFDRSLRDKLLVTTNGEVNWIVPFSSTAPHVIQVVGKCRCPAGQLLLTAFPQLLGLVDELGKGTKVAKVIDFEHFRRKVRPPQSDV
ncbi:MAG TPA: hypothetical protein V6D06_18920 [Trichocoleus sp.]